jgi:hypothetical protein
MVIEICTPLTGSSKMQPVGQLPRTPTYKDARRHWDKRKYGANKFSFPHANKFSPKIILWAPALRRVCQPCPKNISVFKDAKLLACPGRHILTRLGRPHVSTQIWPLFLSVKKCDNWDSWQNFSILLFLCTMIENFYVIYGDAVTPDPERKWVVKRTGVLIKNL